MQSSLLLWDKPYYYLDDKPLAPLVFDGLLPPPGFNTVKIQLDGRLQSDLDWKMPCQQAREAIEKGFFILWEIDLGIFSGLTHPLTHQSQYLSLQLALDHFRDQIWKEFGSRSVGLALYRGSADFSKELNWDIGQQQNLISWMSHVFQSEASFKEETGISINSFQEISPLLLSHSYEGKKLLSFFCRDVGLEYLHLLTNRLPDGLAPIFFLDATEISDPLWQAQLLNMDAFHPLHLAIKGSLLPLPVMTWEGSHSQYGSVGIDLQETASIKETDIGICLPRQEKVRPSQYLGLSAALSFLLDRKISFKIIPEKELTTQWDGLDFMLFVPTGLSGEGRRKLQGFCAAGGAAVTLGEKIGLAHEIQLTNFIEKYYT